MKKAVALILSSALAFTLTSCNFISDTLGFTNAFKLYQSAMEKHNALKSTDIKFEIDIITESLNTVQTVPTVMLMKMNNDGEKPVYYMYTANEIMGSETYESLYYTGNRMYIDQNGTKFYKDMEIEDAKEDTTAAQSENLLDFKEEYFANMPVKRENGLRKIEISFDGNDMRDDLIELTSIENTVSLATDTDAIIISTVDAAFEINADGYLVGYKLKFSLDYKYNWTNSAEEKLISDAKLTFDMEMTVNNPGQAVSIDEPDNLGNYVEGFKSEYEGKYDLSKIDAEDYTELAEKLFDEKDIPVKNFAEIVEQEKENYSEDLINYVLYLKDFYDYYYGDTAIEDNGQTEDTESSENTSSDTQSETSSDAE